MNDFWGIGGITYLLHHRGIWCCNWAQCGKLVFGQVDNFRPVFAQPIFGLNSIKKGIKLRFHQRNLGMERKCVKWWEFLVFWRIMAKNQLFRFIVRKTQQWYCTFYFLRKFHLPNVHLANYTISEFEMPKSLTDDIKLRTYQIWRIIYKWRTVKLRILTKVFLRRKWTLDSFQIVLLLQEFFSWFVCKNSEIMKFFRNQMLHALYLSWTWDLKLRTPGLCHQGDNRNSHNHLYNG